jgi:hypothetical protein
MLCGLVKGRILSTRGKRRVEQLANLGEKRAEDLLSKSEGNSLLGRLRRRWENNIKMVLQGLVWGMGLNLSALYK